MVRRRGVAVVAGACLAALVVAVAAFYNVADLGSQAIRFHPRLIGASIYEYHSKTGRWPADGDDLAKTSLPRQSPHWKQMLQDESLVVVWHRNLKPDPEDNAGLILAYHNKGLLARLGRVWVCWGNLQTEYIKSDDLRANLPIVK